MNFQLFNMQLKREIWENKLRLVYIPAIASGLVLALFITALFNVHPGRKIIMSAEADMVLGKVGGFAALFVSINTFVLLLITALIIVAYAHACLFDDRKSRDILFWRSLPVSEALNVGSKLFTLYVFTPLLVLGLNCVAALIILGGEITLQLLIGKSLGNDSFSIDGLQIGLSLWNMLQMHLLVLVLLLPSIGFMLLMSAWAKRSPLLLSVSIPTALVIIDAIFNKWFGINFNIIDSFVTYKTLLDLILANALDENLHAQGSILLTTDFLLPFTLCVLLGGLFIVAATWLRNNRHEM